MFGKIKELRIACGMSQESLAEKANVPRSIISNLETGKRTNTTVGTLLKLAQALGCQVSDFFTG